MRGSPVSAWKALADRLGDVEPDEVQQRQRAHRVAGPGREMRASTSAASGVRSARSSGPHRRGKGNSSRLTTKPGRSGTSTAVLPKRRAEARRPLASGSGDASGEADLDQLHPRHRVEDVEPEEPPGAADPLRRFGDSDSPEVVVARSASGAVSPSDRGARTWPSPLDDRLDDQIAFDRGRRRRWRPGARWIGAVAPSAGFRRLLLGRQAELRCRRAARSPRRADATAAGPRAIAPLPATAGAERSRWGSAGRALSLPGAGGRPPGAPPARPVHRGLADRRRIYRGKAFRHRSDERRL